MRGWLVGIPLLPPQRQRGRANTNVGPELSVRKGPWHLQYLTFVNGLVGLVH